MEIRTCLNCLTDIKSLNTKKLYCNGKCRSAFHNRGKRPIPLSTICATCNAVFQPKKTSTKACSAKCKRLYYQRRFQKRHKERLSKETSDKTRKLKIEVLATYGNKCVCCGDEHIEFLTIDHVNGNGKYERTNFYKILKRKGFPKELYRCLCMNCNWSLGKFGYCPHNELKNIKPLGTPTYSAELCVHVCEQGAQQWVT